MKYIMGIDQGSSKTYVIIGDERGNVLGLGKSYGACHSSSSLEYAGEAIRQAAEIAFEQSKILPDQIHVIFAGITGVDWDYEGELLKNELLRRFCIDNTFVVNDIIIAMQAGTKNHFGAVLCAGSGLNCAIRRPDGKQFVYGFYIDDEYQGGYALGVASVKAVINSEIGLGDKTILHEMVLDYLNLKNVDELLYYKVKKKISSQDYLHMPLILEKAANMGDQVAKDILSCFGRQYGRFVSRGLKRMDMLNLPVDVVISGSIFKCKEPQLKDGVQQILDKEAPLAKLVDSKYEPIIGAYILGVSQLGSMDDDFYNNLHESSINFNLLRV